MKRKIFSVLLTLVLVLSFGLVTAVPVSAVGHHAPQMEEISGLSVITGDTWDVSTGIVELVFDFYDADNNLVELEIDFGPDPYGDHTLTGGPDNREQMKFQAIAGQEEDPLVLALMASVGMFVNYDDVGQKWTITIDTTATQTQQLIDLGFVPWAMAEGDPIWPVGLFHWYLEVVDTEGNLWGDMLVPPDSSHYVSYFHSIQSAIDDADSGDTINVAAGTYVEAVVLDKSLILQGANAGVPATGVRGPESIIDAGTALVAVLADNVAVESVVIDGFTISNFSKAGIVVKNVLAVQLDNNIVSTEIHTAAPNGIQVGWWDGENTDPTPTTGTISGNRVSDSTWYLYDPTVPDAYEGELPGGGTNWTGSGILVIAPNSELAISHNEVFDNDVGLDIEAGPLTVLSNNDVHDNSYGFILWNADSSINFNNIYGNDLAGVYRTAQGDSTGTLNAKYNWWGDCSGPGVVGPGTGDTVSANVDYDSWLGKNLSDLRVAIGDLDDDDFNKLKAASGQKQALLNKVNSVCDQFGAGSYRGALNKLQRDITKRIEKWINNPPASDLIDLVEAETEVLEYFLP